MESLADGLRQRLGAMAGRLRTKRGRQEWEWMNGAWRRALLVDAGEDGDAGVVLEACK
jgi:hypothetical protein